MYIVCLQGMFGCRLHGSGHSMGAGVSGMHCVTQGQHEGGVANGLLQALCVFGCSR